jgi:hypothetical protein
VEAGLDCGVWPGATRGVVTAWTRCPNARRALVRRRGASNIPAILCVNSRAGITYGSTSVDCHYPLRHRARALADLYDEAPGAGTGANCASACTECFGRSGVSL